MKLHVGIGALVVALVAGSRGLGAEPGGTVPFSGSSQDCFLNRLGPVGGWHPYGGGLFHWWPRHGFPRCGAPDDYCRKPLPNVCSQPYSPYYTSGPPEICHPRSNGWRDCNRPH